MSNKDILLRKEIERKLSFLCEEEIAIHSGDHANTFHIAVSDRDMLSRQKEEHLRFVSSFTSKKIFDAAIYSFVADNIDYIVKWLEDDSAKERLEEEYFLEETVGRVVLPNGGIRTTELYHVTLQKNDNRTGAAEMPFDVVTMFPCL